MSCKTGKSRRTPPYTPSIFLVAMLSLTAFLPALRASGQDQLTGGINSGVATIRIAVADFKPAGADAQTTALKSTFDSTLYADLASAGIFDIVSKSLMPPGSPGSPSEIQLALAQFTARHIPVLRDLGRAGLPVSYGVPMR